MTTIYNLDGPMGCLQLYIRPLAKDTSIDGKIVLSAYCLGEENPTGAWVRVLGWTSVELVGDQILGTLSTSLRSDPVPESKREKVPLEEALFEMLASVFPTDHTDAIKWVDIHLRPYLRAISRHCVSRVLRFYPSLILASLGPIALPSVGLISPADLAALETRMAEVDECLAEEEEGGDEDESGDESGDKDFGR